MHVMRVFTLNVDVFNSEALYWSVTETLRQKISEKYTHE